MLLRNGVSVGYYFALSSSLLLFTMVMLLLGVQTQAVNDKTNNAKSSFESGYDHGCSDVKIIDFSDRYINQPGKGPSFHTEEFMRGYDTGYNACS